MALCLRGAQPLMAGTITLDTQIDATPHAGRLHIEIRVFSHGDEAAYHLQFKIEVPEAGTASPIFSKLDVGEKRSVSLEVPVQGLGHGRYPLLLRTLYTDVNQYPFSALALSSYAVGEDASPGVLALLGHCAMDRSGRIRLRLKNLDGIPKNLTVRLFLPQELSSPQAVLEIPLSPGQETEAFFALRNFSALDNSRYAVFAVVEYALNGRHFMASAPGLIEIRPGAFLEQYRGYLLAAFGILLILFIAFHLFAAWRHYPVTKQKK